MDLFSVNGLPVHVLLVHLVVVLVPATALAAVLATVWPAFRRRIGIVLALLGLVVIALVPVTEQAGQWLKARVPATPLIETHAGLGGALWPWTLALGILSVAVWAWYLVTGRRNSRGAAARRSRRAVAVVLAVLAFGLGGMATYQTVLVGESGSRAIWQNSFSETPR